MIIIWNLISFFFTTQTLQDTSEHHEDNIIIIISIRKLIANVSGAAALARELIGMRWTNRLGFKTQKNYKIPGFGPDPIEIITLQA